MTMATETQGTPADQAVPAAESVETTPPSTSVTEATPGSSPAPGTGSEFNWDDDRNPYRYAATQLQQQMEQRETAWAQQQAVLRTQQLEAQGLSPEQAQASVANEYAQWQLQKNQERLNTQARPVVAHVLAQQIQEKYGVTIKAQELLATSAGAPINSVDAMLARADAIMSERRRANSNSRKAAGADKLDGGGAGVATVDTKAYRKMRPSAIIAMGLREQQ